MIYILSALCVIYPLITIWAYRQGIKDGKCIINNEPIKPVVTPLPSRAERQERKETQDKEEAVRARIKKIDDYKP